jgi:hypothetical protein
MAVLREGRRDDYRIEAPGFGVESIAWFRDHDVALVANDTYAFEVWPPEHPEAMMAVHMLDLRDVGLTQGQLCDAPARHRRGERHGGARRRQVTAFEGYRPGRSSA